MASSMTNNQQSFVQINPSKSDLNQKIGNYTNILFFETFETKAI